MKNQKTTLKQTKAKSKDIQRENLAQNENGEPGTSYAADTQKNKAMAKKAAKEKK